MKKESISTIISPAQCTIVNNNTNNQFQRKMSDTQSIASSDVAASHPSGLVIEELGVLALGEVAAPKKLSVINYTLAVLCEDGKLVLGEVRTISGSDWTLAGRSVQAIGEQNGTRWLDMTIVNNSHQSSGASVVLLGERKNKERFLSAHHITHGRTLELTEEISSYEKSNVLGKAVSHLATDASAEEPTVFAVSNLLRKLKLEDGGTTLKPTPARAQVPSDCLDGTLCICVQPTASPRPSSAMPGSTGRSHQVHVALGLKTKSATGKNKFAIEWYSSRKDDVSYMKSSSTRLPEDMEPVALLSDPRDARGVYALFVNRATSTTSIYRVSSTTASSKGTVKLPDQEPVARLNYEVKMAALGLSADSQNLLLLTIDSGGAASVVHVYTMHKTEGSRSRHPACSKCPPLVQLESQAHIVSCATSRWQLNANLVDMIVGPMKSLHVALASLIGPGGGVVAEPDSGHHYRLRLVGCPTRQLTPESMLVEDLEKIFEDDPVLANATLKLCLSYAPSRESHSLLSGLLMAGKLGAIELYYVRQSSTDDDIMSASSDRFIAKPISADKFRNYITDVDWTLLSQGRQGTFTLQQESGGTFTLSEDATDHQQQQRPSTRSSMSRIPTRSSGPPSSSGASTSTNQDDLEQQQHMLNESREQLNKLLKKLSATMSTVKDVDEALRHNLESMNDTIGEIQNIQAASPPMANHNNHE